MAYNKVDTDPPVDATLRDILPCLFHTVYYCLCPLSCIIQQISNLILKSRQSNHNYKPNSEWKKSQLFHRPCAGQRVIWSKRVVT